ncbi:M3 family metallopeptidase [Patescibacteria group bacterium]
MKTIKLTKRDFAWTKWGPKDINKSVKFIIAEKKKRYAEIKKIPASERTFENTIYALEVSDYGLDDEAGYIHVLNSLSPDKKVRDAAQKAEKELSKHLIDIEYDPKLYEAVKEYKKNQKKLKEKLDEADEKLLKDMIRGYKRMGFDLPKEKQRDLKKTLKRSNKLASDFDKNINEYKDHILVTKDELDGLSEQYIDGLSKDKKSGKYKVTLEYPDMVPFMKNAKNAEKRRELADRNLQNGGVKNIKILNEILELRKKSAKLLGYKHHADFVTEERMVKSAKKADTFIKGLMKKVNREGKNDLKDLARIKTSVTGKKCKLPEYYDVAHYADILQKEKFNIDSEALREYFPLKHVKKEMFTLFGSLFDVKFEKLNGYPLWHKDVELYGIIENGKVISYLLFDMFPRDGKYGHAMCTGFVSGQNTPFSGNEYKAPIACVVMNVNKPTKKSPSLLTHGDVQTLFHEFGHSLHHTLTKTKYSSQAGMSVTRDFVEVPSQILENWVWDEKMLKKLSKHYKTGKTLSRETIKNLKDTKMFMIHHFIVRQLIFGLFDMEIHTKNFKNTAKLYADLQKKYLGMQLPKEQIFPAGFGHMMGYDAGYYGYMWSLVFADDMFSKFKKAGLTNKKVGMEYKKWILEKGSSVDEMRLVENFLGRKPNNKAFLKEIGIK